MESIIPFKNKYLIKFYRKLCWGYSENKYFKNFFKNINYPPPDKGKVLIYAGIGSMFLTPLEVLMYHLLKKEGYQVDYFIYDKNVPINELITQDVFKKLGKDKFWNRSVLRAKRILDSSNVKYDFISAPDEVENIMAPLKDDIQKILKFEYEDIHFGNIVRGVMYRFYKSTNFGKDGPLRANQFLKTSLTNYFQVKKLYKENSYKFFFFSHGIYCTWEPVRNYCDINKVPFICYDRGKRIGTANFNINHPSPDWSFDHAWIRYKEKKLNNDEEKMVDQYLKERELQKGDVYSYNSAERINDINFLKQSLKIKPHAKVITIFTNLIWDAANVARDIAFSSAFDCIEQTILRYCQNTDVHILIRSHPAEKIVGTNERYGQLIKDKFQNQLPENVTVIEPELNINSFSVIDISDIGVVNTSTVGLEFALANKPIILISETNYRNKGFTYDVTSEIDYFSKLDALLNKRSIFPDQANLARKYFYMMMFLYQKKMPLKFDKNIFNGYTYKNFNSIPQNNEIEKIIKLLNNKEIDDFIFWD
jgi:hypothetical protein